MQRIAACIFDGGILIFHFYADFQTLVRQENRSHGGLRETPFAAAIAGILFFEEPVHGPLDVLAEILGEKQTKFVGIGNFGRAALFLLLFFSSFTHRRWNFFVSNRADAEFVFCEKCWIERNLVPISKSPSCFQTHCSRAAATIEPFELRFRRYVKTIGQTHFDLLGEKIIGRSVAEALTLKKFAEEECPWRQHVGIYCVGETAARKLGWRAVRAGHFFVRAGHCPGAVTTTGRSVVACPKTELLTADNVKHVHAISRMSRLRPISEKNDVFFIEPGSLQTCHD